MAFNQLLMSLNPKVFSRLVQENRCEEVYNSYCFNDLPESTKVFIKQFELALRENGTFIDLIDRSTGFSKTPYLPINSLYLQAFYNGVIDIIKDFNLTLVTLCEMFLKESNVTEVFDLLDQHICILASLISALGQVNEEKFQGCKILDLCEQLLVNNPHVPENIFRKVQKHCLKVFYEQTKLWLIQASLSDPHSEYFITSDISQLSAAENSSWNTTINADGNTHDRQDDLVFKINQDNLPLIIPLSIAMKILFIGEALRICHYKESESQRNERILSDCGINEQRISERFSEIEKETFCLKNFSNFIDDFWTGVNKYILVISNEIGNIKDQLTLMWELYLLGRGELFQEFLIRGSSLLNMDFTQIDSRMLNIAFKDAIYYVYLTEYSDITDQFFFKLPKRNALGQGFTTWSVMELKCKVKWPLHYLFTQEVMTSFNRLFIFLLRLKKAQIDITTTWKSINSIVNHKLRMELIEIRMNLLAVVGNLQNYCFTYVIANEMTVLLESAEHASMFTDLQKAVNLFLINISNRLFLPDPCFSATHCNSSSVETVNKCFQTIFEFCQFFSELDTKQDDNVLLELSSFKTKLNNILKTLFSVLNNIDQNCYFDMSNPTFHLYNLMLCLDFNRFFRNKFKLSSFD